MGEASRLGKKGKSLTARHFSFQSGSLFGLALESVDSIHFDVLFLPFYFFLSFVLFRSRQDTTLQLMLPSMQYFFLFYSFPYSSSLLFGIWGSWGYHIYLCFVGSDFIHQGAKKKHELFFTFMWFRGYGVRGHVAICFLYPWEGYGKIVFSRQASTEGEAPTCLGQAASSLDGWCFGLRKRALGYLDAMHSSPPVEMDRFLDRSRRGGMHQDAAPEPCVVSHY
ncbi:hypothetical protein V8C42DRAFT_252745 [Trichoderma barbatum]